MRHARRTPQTDRIHEANRHRTMYQWLRGPRNETVLPRGSVSDGDLELVELLELLGVGDGRWWVSPLHAVTSKSSD